MLFVKKIILISLLTAALVFIPGCGQDNPDEEKSSLPESSINSFTLESTEPSEVSQAVYLPPSDAIYMFNGDTVGPLYKQTHQNNLPARLHPRHSTARGISRHKGQVRQEGQEVPAAPVRGEIKHPGRLHGYTDASRCGRRNMPRSPAKATDAVSARQSRLPHVFA